MELFVTNESTLLHIYQSLFPDKVKKNPQKPIKTSPKHNEDSKYFITETNLEQYNRPRMNSDYMQVQPEANYWGDTSPNNS